jgi:hypothetical protein
MMSEPCPANQNPSGNPKMTTEFKELTKKWIRKLKIAQMANDIHISLLVAAQ